MLFNKVALLSIMGFSASKKFVNAANVPQDAICLTQDDFNLGTKIISTSGIYKLCSDIVFGPNGPTHSNETPSETAFDPDLSNYAENEFGLGFFAALAIAADDVTLYLNGHTIEQSAGHALMQRFFAVIELANSPFISNAGPAQFVSGGGSAYAAASNVNILGPGTIGRSSHHGIHGNENTNVIISDVTFQDFEVAAVSLNNVDGLVISKNTISGNRKDVPITGMFSAARFIRPYGKYLKDMNYSLKDSSGAVWKTAEQAYDDLIVSINNVYEDVIYNGGTINSDTHPVEHHLFDNPHRVVDGPCYALLVHGKGPAVGGMGEVFNENDPTTTSSNIVIEDNIINDIKCWNNEVPALLGACGNHGCIQNDPRGAVFQTVKTFGDDQYLSIDADGKYISNVVADMQLIVSSAILDETLVNMPARQIGPNSITQDLIDWATSGNAMTPKYVCNGDSMHHVVKGIMAIRVEDSEGISITGNIVGNVENLSFPPFDNCYDYHIGNSIENVDQQQLGDVRAVSAAADRGTSNKLSSIKKNVIVGITSSDNANTIVGIDIQGDTKGVAVTLNKADLEDTDNILTSSVEDALAALDTATINALRDALGADIEDTLDIGGESTGTSLALRIRGLTSGCIEKNNIFVQPIQTSSRRIRVRALSHASHPHVSGFNEWSYGGCPFNDDYAEIKVDPPPF